MANEEINEEMLIPQLKIDLLLDSDDVNFQLIENLKTLEPFGYGNSKPTIAIKECIVVSKKTMGQEGKHMKLMLKGDGIELITSIMFNCDEDVEKINENDKLDIVGYPNVNVWNGTETLQFIINEWKFSDK